MFIYNDNAALALTNNADRNGIIAENDDYKQLDRGSQVEFSGSYDGRYWIKIWNKDPSPRVGSGTYNPTYNVALLEIGASATTTPSIATPYPQGIDRFEYNGDFDTRCADRAKHEV